MKKCMIIFLLLIMGTLLFSLTGDVDKNGTVNIIDALLIAKYSVLSPVVIFDVSVADVNGDDVINVIDALLIAQFCVGIIPELFTINTRVSPMPKATSVAKSGKKKIALKKTVKKKVSKPSYISPSGRTTVVSTVIPKASGKLGSATVVGSATSLASSSDLMSISDDPFPVVVKTPHGVSLPKPSLNSTLRAGYADDNMKFNNYLGFLDKYSENIKYYEMKIYERIILKIKDQNGKSLPNAKVVIYDEKEEPLCQGKSYADGSFMFFPAEYGEASQYRVTIEFQGQTKKLELKRKAERHIDVVFDLNRPVYEYVPLDMLFVMDTTGSMGEEIRQLKTTIKEINKSISSLSSKPLVRYGMVLYRDRSDGQSSYLTRIIPLTYHLDYFQQELNKVGASGGGDKQENLEQALEEAMNEIKWNKDGIRLAWVITDAGPKLYEDETYRYVNAAKDAHKAGIKFYSIGAGGLELGGEYVLRQISQYTSAKYIFLTYGEKGESDGGFPGSVSHHTGDDFETDKLESIVLHFTEEELSHLDDKLLTKKDSYFEAKKIKEETQEETLVKLFDQATKELINYSSISLKKDSLITNLPILTKEGVSTPEGEYFSELLSKSLSKNTVLIATKDKDIQKILSELSFDIPNLLEDSKAALVGAKAGAKVIISTNLTNGESGYELNMKLLRVETPEVLGKVTAKISLDLGPTP